MVGMQKKKTPSCAWLNPGFLQRIRLCGVYSEATS